MMVYKPCWISICYFWKMSSWNTFLNGSKGLTWQRGFWKQEFGMNLLKGKKKKPDLKEIFKMCPVTNTKYSFPVPLPQKALRTILTTRNPCTVYTTPGSDKEPSPACKWGKTGFTLFKRMNKAKWIRHGDCMCGPQSLKIPPGLL